MQIILEQLPLSPSVNHVWKHRAVKGRAMVYMSKEGIEFRAKIASIVKSMQLQNLPLTERLSVKIILNMPDKRRRDIDNFVKSAADSLTHAGLWLDDSQIDELIIIRGEIVKGGAMRVTVTEL